MRRNKTLTDENFKVIEVIEVSDFKEISHKVSKVGKTNKANRMVKNRQKLEATEHEILGKIDFKDRRKADRLAKRKEKRMR